LLGGSHYHDFISIVASWASAATPFSGGVNMCNNAAAVAINYTFERNLFRHQCCQEGLHAKLLISA
jgi:hypothetical protein